MTQAVTLRRLDTTLGQSQGGEAARARHEAQTHNQRWGAKAGQPRGGKAHMHDWVITIATPSLPIQDGNVAITQCSAGAVRGATVGTGAPSAR